MHNIRYNVMHGELHEECHSCLKQNQRVKELQEIRSLSTEAIQELLNVRQKVFNIVSAHPTSFYGNDQSKANDTAGSSLTVTRKVKRLISISEELARSPESQCHLNIENS